MTEEMLKDLIPVITAIVMVIAFFLVFFTLKRFFNRLANRTTRKYLGMSAAETAKFISDGLKNEATLPKPITSLNSIYMPKIKRDFPEMGYENMEALAKTTLINFLNAVEADKINASFPSSKLTAQLENTINDNRSRGVVEHFDTITIHKAGISKYNNDANEASVLFELAAGYIHFYTKNGQISSGSKTTPEQAAYKVILTYSQQVEETSEAVFASSCPNCGAPVSASGVNKKCKFCGCGITEISERIWVVTEIRKFA